MGMAGAGLYSATPEGRGVLGSYVVMGGFNGVIGVLRSLEMGLLTTPLWLSGAGGVLNVYRLSRMLNPFILLTGVYCGYLVITVVSADMLGADEPPRSSIVDMLSAGSCLPSYEPERRYGHEGFAPFGMMR